MKITCNPKLRKLTDIVQTYQSNKIQNRVGNRYTETYQIFQTDQEVLSAIQFVWKAKPGHLLSKMQLEINFMPVNIMPRSECWTLSKYIIKLSWRVVSLWRRGVSSNSHQNWMQILRLIIPYKHMQTKKVQRNLWLTWWGSLGRAGRPPRMSKNGFLEEQVTGLVFYGD